MVFEIYLDPFETISGSIKFRIGKGMKTPYLHSEVILNCTKTPPYHKLELGNSNFRNQRTRVGKNSYVTKNRTKMPVGGTVWWPV